jgi:phage gpG-like protein
MKVGLRRAADRLQAEWQDVLSVPGTGREYRHEYRYSAKKGRVIPLPHLKRWKVHRASAPGDAPAPDSGDLRRSILVVEVDHNTIRVGTNLRYGLALEYGVNVAGSKVGPHPDPSFRIEPRPHARPALKRAQGDMDELIKTSLRYPGKGAR